MKRLFVKYYLPASGTFTEESIGPVAEADVAGLLRLLLKKRNVLGVRVDDLPPEVRSAFLPGVRVRDASEEPELTPEQEEHVRVGVTR